MACTYTGSQILDCKDSIGGIKEIKIKAHPGLATIESDFVISSGSVTSVASGSRSLWCTLNLEKEAASANADPQVNQANGTTFYQHQVKMLFNKMSARLSYEIHLYAKNRSIIAVRDMNDRYTLYGLKFGMDMSAATAGTGQARGDRNGYDITLIGKEDLPEQEITSAIWATLVS